MNTNTSHLNKSKPLDQSDLKHLFSLPENKIIDFLNSKNNSIERASAFLILNHTYQNSMLDATEKLFKMFNFQNDEILVLIKSFINYENISSDVIDLTLNKLSNIDLTLNKLSNDEDITRLILINCLHASSQNMNLPATKSILSYISHWSEKSNIVFVPLTIACTKFIDNGRKNQKQEKILDCFLSNITTKDLLSEIDNLNTRYYHDYLSSDVVDYMVEKRVQIDKEDIRKNIGSENKKYKHYKI